MLNVFAVFVGGGLGAVLRYLVGVFCSSALKVNFPISTLSVNFIGCLILGFLYVFFLDRNDFSQPMKYLLTVGFCGGLTTFSTFSLEIFDMFEKSNYNLAILYLVASLVLGLVGILIGGYLCKTFII